MTDLLVSVRTAEEAAVVAAAGVRWVDVKEPRRGPLGRADEATWHAVAGVLPADAQLTLALGEAGDPVPDYIAIPERTTLVKLGPHGCPLEAVPGVRAAWEAAAGRPLPWAGVVYVDDAVDLADRVAFHESIGDRFLLFDTGDKSGRSAIELIDTLPPTTATTCLAGRLTTDDLPQAVALADIVGVRSAVTRGPRDGAIDPDRLMQCVDAVSGRAATTESGSPSVVVANTGASESA